jgi:hypothetical protein
MWITTERLDEPSTRIEIVFHRNISRRQDPPAVGIDLAGLVTAGSRRELRLNRETYRLRRGLSGEHVWAEPKKWVQLSALPPEQKAFLGRGWRACSAFRIPLFRIERHDGADAGWPLPW